MALSMPKVNDRDSRLTFTEGKATVRLKHGEGDHIIKLPLLATYKVTETRQMAIRLMSMAHPVRKAIRHREAFQDNLLKQTSLTFIQFRI